MTFVSGSLDGLTGPPTPFALRVRPWLILIFAMLGFVGLARLALLDVTGGLFLVLAVFIGYMAIRKGMNIAWLLCLAMILFLNSMLDGFLVLALGLRTQWDFFFKKQPWYLFLGRFLTFIGPMLELVGAYLSWAIYKTTWSIFPAARYFSSQIARCPTTPPSRHGRRRRGPASPPSVALRTAWSEGAIFSLCTEMLELVLETKPGMACEIL
mmetsp:Transcript_69030/g.152340  ORF Transcript_69030/g.152340 Transcript_69030/m.152340 type:complete len:211 (+) Transcript_69030:121-753(+)